MFKKTPPSPLYKRGASLPFVKGGEEGFYKTNVVSNRRPLITVEPDH